MGELKIITYFLITLLVFIIGTIKTEDDNCRLIIDIHTNLNRYYTKNCNKITNFYYICNGFGDIARIPLTNRTCIRLRQNQRLNSVVSFNHVTDLRIYSFPLNFTFQVKCNDGHHIPSGLDFKNSDFISITNIEFLNCGHSNPSSVRLPQTGEIVSIVTALYFNEVTNVSLSNVGLGSCHGYAVAIYNSYGIIDFDKITVWDNFVIGFKSKEGRQMKGFSSGGAIYIEYNAVNITNKPSHISVIDSYFYNNTADTISPTPLAEGMAEGHIGFGRGGAFSLFYLENTTNIHVLIENVTFDHNLAAWGGAVYARFRGSSFNNTIEIVDTAFQGNVGHLSGGGLFATVTQIRATNNLIHFTGCRFEQNRAELGGGLVLKFISKDSIEKKQFSTITETEFIGNEARIGFAMDLEKVPLVFRNIFMKQNTGTEASGQGAIYTFDSVLYLGGFNFINNNKPTAIVTDCSTLHLTGEVNFSNNTGENGGALAMYGASRLVLYNSTRLTFHKNSAWRRGGAVYVKYSGPSIDQFLVHALNFEQCFIQFAEASLKRSVEGSFGGRVLFDHNYADINGDGIFVTSLISCATGSSLNDTLSKWKGFSFLPNNREHITTHAINITINPKEWEQSPGELFTPKVILHDQRGNHVSEQINVDIWENPIPDCVITIESGKRFIVTEDDNISLTLLGNNQPQYNCSYHITISLVWNNFTSVTIRNLALKPCYFGYTFNPKTKQCRCMMSKNRAKGIAYCYQGEIFFFNNRWASPRQKAYQSDNEITVPCPTGYCKSCHEKICRYSENGVEECSEEPVCKYNENNPIQCEEHRDQNSTLCGSCAEGYSVVLGGEKCVRCDGSSKYNFIWIIIVLVAFFTAFDVFIIWLGIDIYSNYLNGLLYYCQAIVLLPPSSFQFWQPTAFIIGIVNMESTGSTIPPMCFIKGFNDLHKQLFNYTFPAIMLFILYVIGRMARRPNSYFARRNCLGAFTIISVIAYTDITRITFNLLNFTRIDPASNKRWVWIHGDTEYFSREHIPYATVAIFMCVAVVLGFPLVLVFSSKLVAVRLGYNPFTQLTPIFGHFTYCFRKDCFHFSSFYFFARLVMLGITTFSAIGPLSSTLKAMFCYLVCICFAYNKPYKYVMMNWFDLSILVNLTVISVISLLMRGCSSQKQDLLTVVMNLLIFLPFLCFTLPIVWVYGKKCWIYTAQRIPKRTPASSRSPDFHYPKRTIFLPEDRHSIDDSANDNSCHSDDDHSLHETENSEENYNRYQNME